MVAVIAAALLPVAAARQTATITADSIRDDGETLQVSGDVEVAFRQYRLCAPQAQYARGDRLLHLSRGAQLKYDNLQVDAGEGYYDFIADEGGLQDFTTTADDRRLQIAGESAQFRRDVFSARNAYITSCAGENQAWRLFAEEAREDRGDQTIQFKNARLELAGVPVMALPAASLYYGSDNRSGFLPPNIQLRSGGNWSVETPYYLALDKSYDWTITPHWRATEGVEVANEARFVTANSEGEVNINQVVFGSGNARARQSLRYALRQGRWRFNIAADNTSDDNYLRDYGRDNDEKATRHLPRELTAEYEGDGWSGRLFASSYKTLSDGLDEPHQLAPQLEVRQWGNWGGGGVADWEQWWQWSRFKHRHGGDTDAAGAAPSGSRYIWRGAASRPIYAGDLTITPYVGAQATRYDTERAGESPSFFVPFARLDMASDWPAPHALGIDDYLSLRLALIYSARREQSRAPLYDAVVKQPSLENLFDINRYAGGDRFSDDRMVVYSGEYQRFGRDGREQAYIGFGQRFYFQDSRARVAGETPPQGGAGDVFMDTRVHFGRDWRFAGDAQWDIGNGEVERFYGDVRGRLGAARAVQVGVLLEEEESLTAGFATPLGAGIELAVTGDYLLAEDVMAKNEVFLRVRDAADCWRFTLKLERVFVDVDQDDWTVAVGLELVDLGGVGQDYNTILRKLQDDF